MRRRLITAITTFALVGMILAGCGDTKSNIQSSTESNIENTVQDTSQEEVSTQDIPLTYSFLYDDTTRNEIRDIMKNDGVPEEQVEAFMTIVTQFADTMGEMKGSADGYTTIDASKIFYDADYIGENFMNKLGFSDQNCRLTAYSLFNSFYEVSEDSSFVYEDESLYGDTEILKDNSNLKFSDEDMRKYTTLFADVKVDKTTDATVLASNVKDVWSQRGISFNNQDKVKLATIMNHNSENDTVYAGHAGVVFTTDEGYLLIEKLSQYTPFVAGKFTNLSDLRMYMLSEVAFLGTQENSAEPFIMLNDELLAE